MVLVNDLREIEALTFDVFGTVVDWRTSIIREGQALRKRLGLDTDWAALADAWRAGYRPAMDRVRAGELPWTRIDDLHRMILDDLVEPFALQSLGEGELWNLNRVWHRLQPWPDVVGGLRRLKRHYVIASLSNGNVSLLTNMAKFADLPWDCVLSAELAGTYKTDPEVYRTACRLLDLSPARVMMVAAHERDVLAAKGVGMRTAYVHRPLEYGPEAEAPEVDTSPFDLVVDDLAGLADALDAW